MDYYLLIVMRVLHITAGALWVGASVYTCMFLMPAVHKLGQAGGKVMQQIMKTNRLPMVMSLLSLTTVVTGIVLYYKVSGGFQKAWMSSSHGMLLTAGGLIGLGAFVSAFIFIVPTVNKISATGAAIAKADGPPSPDQVQLMEKLGRKLTVSEIWITSSQVLSLVLMSLIRYI